MSTAAVTGRPPVKTTLPAEFRAEGRRLTPAEEPLATFLGVFSIGLGLWESLALRAAADRTGVRHAGLLRAYGLREIVAGAGILAASRPTGWLWARVAGDVLDLAALGAAYADAGRADRRRTLAAAAAVAGVTALDIACARAHSHPGP